MLKDEDWKTAAQSESIGRYHTGVRIQIFIGHRELVIRDENGDFTDEYWEIQKKAGEIANIIGENNIRLDPKEQERAVKEKADIIALFSDPIFVQEIPNGYCSQYCCKHLPWFCVTTKIGMITIGWRKRVISIDWRSSQLMWTADELFPDQDVTKDGRLIHAYGYEKAKFYLERMFSVPPVAPPEIIAAAQDRQRKMPIAEQLALIEKARSE